MTIKSTSVNALTLKAEAMSWLRFAKQMPAVCTEVRFGINRGKCVWQPDVLGCCNEYSIEVEVKLSRSDLKNDIPKKASKFFLYKNAASENHNKTIAKIVPNYFYYMVGPALEAAAVELAKQELPFAGVIVYDESNGLSSGRFSRVAKPAQKIHHEKPGPAIVHEVLMRTSSELCCAKLSMCKLQADVERVIANVEQAANMSGAWACGLLDFEEDKAADMEAKAAELARCVEGLNWDVLPTKDKQKWLDATDRLLRNQRSEPWSWNEALFK